MKTRINSARIALLTWLALILIAAPVTANGISAQEGDNSTLARGTGEPLMVFDLKAFLDKQQDSKLAYDYMKLATALQGLVNRDRPQLFFLYESNYIAKQNNMETDRFWLDELRKPGAALENYTIETVDDFNDMLDRFETVYNGVVVWDSQVPATSNVASTAAGVDGLLPLRYDLTPGSPYDVLIVKRGLPVKLDLTGKFTGTGMIPDSDLASTGSAKNDAYLWAKARYLDTGLTNPGMMVYALDGVSWSINESAKDLSAKVLSTAIPETMNAGQELEVSITFENTGKAAWTQSTNDRLGATDSNKFMWANLNGGFSNGPANQRIFLGPDERIEPGQRKTFKFTLIAPEEKGTYTFSARFVRDGVTWYGDELTRTIEVVAEGAPAEPPAEVPMPSAGGQIVYPDLFNSFLPNADYFISNKAFFFDLSPDETSLPVDDRSQPLGTDYRTLIELLRSQNKLAGESIITIGGFVPWWLKYTNAADSQANLHPVAAEWKYADIISKYNAQKDADAYGLVGLSNASVYRHVPLHNEFVQKNDKGQNGKSYDPDTKYVMFYMGDYDSGAWTAGALPALWNDPKRGELPLAWAPVPGLSKRVPQVFNYLYDTMTPNDYFVAGDNGAGYLNPMMLQKANRPDGLPDFLHVWEEYNRGYYEKFDLDITGFLISGNSGYASLPVQEAYSRFSPAGVGNNNGFEQPVVNGTPFAKVTDLGHEVSDASAYGEQLAGQLRSNSQFFNFRTILTKPSMIVDAVNYVKAKYPDIRFEVVDPYTYFRLYKEGKGWEAHASVTYNSVQAKASVKADGIAEPGEWDDAEAITVNPTDPSVQKYGKVWGTESDAQDLNVAYKIKWDRDNLYLLEQRQDDALHFTETGSKMYLSDATMLFLDLDRSKNGAAYRDGDYALMLTPNGPDGQPHMFMREGHDDGLQEFPYTAGQIGSRVTNGGYTMEAAIPWSSLQVKPFQPKAEARIGMTLLATDNDGPGNWGQIMWVGDGDAQERWADLCFIAQRIGSVEEGLDQIGLLLADGSIGNSLKKQLTNAFSQAQHHWEKGQVKQAAHALENFVKHLNGSGGENSITPEQKEKLLQLAVETTRLINANQH